MNQFVYFIPGKRVANLAMLAGAGLGHVFDGEGFSARLTECGPGDQGGILVSLSRGEILHAPERQTWEKSLAGNFWLGYDHRKKPAASDLAREDGAPGRWNVTLCDGNAWSVPTARLWPEGTALPQVRKYAEGGRVVRDVKEKFRELYLAADEVWQALATGGEMPEGRAQEICELALRTNYRVSHDELNLLGLLDDLNVVVLLQVLVSFPDWPKQEE